MLVLVAETQMSPGGPLTGAVGSADGTEILLSAVSGRRLSIRNRIASQTQLDSDAYHLNTDFSFSSMEPPLDMESCDYDQSEI